MNGLSAILMSSLRLTAKKGAFNTLKNDTVTGTGFPLLVKGENRFILGGGITDGSVFPRWCSL